MTVTFTVGHCLKLCERLLLRAEQLQREINTNKCVFSYLYTFGTPSEVTDKVIQRASDNKSKILNLMNEYIKIINLRTKIRNKIMEYNLKSGISELMAEREANNNIIKKYNNLISVIELANNRNEGSEYYEDVDFTIIDKRFTETSVSKKEMVNISSFNDKDIEEFKSIVSEYTIKNHEISDKIVSLNEKEISFDILEIDEEYIS